MNIIKTKENDTLTIALEGRLDTTTSPQLEGDLRNSVNGVTKLVFDLEKLDYLYVDYYHYRDKDETPPLSYHYGTQGLNPATLTLDQPYDDSFGFHYGNLEITLLQSSESCNIQTALRYLQEIDSLLTESGVGYYVLELSLKAPSSKSEFHIYGVRREDLHCEDPLSRLQELWNEQEAHRQEIKASYEK